VRGPITSPTFVIARVHPPLRGDGSAVPPGGTAQRPALVHADAYRLGSALELDDLDLDADTSSSVTVVEWGEGLAEGLASDRLEIAIAPDADRGGGLDDMTADRARTVRISAVGERWEGIKLPLADPADRL